MAINRPKISVPSAAQSAQFINSSNKFFNIKDGQTAVLRFLPVPDGAPSIFFPANNHHGLKKEDGTGEAALACLATHGVKETGRKCAICDVLALLRDSGADDYKPILKAVGFRKRFYAQVMNGILGRDDRGKQIVAGWSRPMLFQMSQTLQQDLQLILEKMETAGDDLFYDPDNGQAIEISRSGSGFDTVYRPERTSIKVALEAIRPEWADEFIDDIYKVVNLNVFNREVQLQYLQRSYPKLPWDAILAEVGV